MKGLELLLEKRWVLKAENKEQYYRIRDEVSEIRKFATDKLGCQIIENAFMVKMEKIPAIPEAFMGIQEFSTQVEYAFFCILLMFLEDKEAEEQFVLSQLTEYIEGNMMEEKVDWTVYSTRCKLIRVLKYAVERGILKITDGNEDGFRDVETSEVLYEHTGVARYFMRIFQRDIMSYQGLADFYESDWVSMDEDRGVIRRHRVYKRILFLPGIYKEDGSEEDFEYLKYYGRRLVEELEQQFPCRIHIHRGSAYLLVNDGGHMGTTFPGVGNLSNIILLCCGKIQDKIATKEWIPREDEIVVIEKVELEQLVRKLKEVYENGFGKEYREMAEGKFISVVLEELQRWTFIRIEELQVLILPLCGKMVGSYPEDFKL